MKRSQFCESDNVLIRELLADEGIPETIKDEIVKEGIDHIQSTWSDRDRNVHQVQKADPVGIVRIDVHHMNGQLEYRSVMLVTEQRARRAKK